MSEKEDDLAKEIELLRSVENKGTGEKLKTYTKLCGPGWLQSAITVSYTHLTLPPTPYV